MKMKAAALGERGGGYDTATAEASAGPPERAGDPFRGTPC